MSEQKRRFWFAALSRAGGKIVHIISARTIGEARASMGPVSGEYQFAPMTWGDINRLAGIVPPITEPVTGLAEGHLLYDFYGRTISIEVAD